MSEDLAQFRRSPVLIYDSTPEKAGLEDFPCSYCGARASKACGGRCVPCFEQMVAGLSAYITRRVKELQKLSKRNWREEGF